jgi:Myb/SANT-like DNA-binding domain
VGVGDQRGPDSVPIRNIIYTGFSKKAWEAVTNAFSVEFKVQYTKEQLKSHLQIVSCIYFTSSSVQSDQKLLQLKKRYASFKQLKETSGFGWDDQRQMVTAPDSVWDRYLEVCVSVSHESCSLFVPYPRALKIPARPFYKSSRRRTADWILTASRSLAALMRALPRHRRTALRAGVTAD